MVLRQGCAVALVAGLLAGGASPAVARTTTRYFEVKIHGTGQLDSGPFCTASNPCSGDYLTNHAMTWSWIAYALIVAQQTGRHTSMHLIGPAPRVAAYFDESTLWSRRDGCTADFSTGDGVSLDRFMTTGLRFHDADGVLSVDVGAPVDRHFSQCGAGTVSQHGRDGSLTSWDGLKGPWSYRHVRPPTRAEVRRKHLIADLAYTKGLGIEHDLGGWHHRSCCGSSLDMTFTSFPGGKDSVFRHERAFARRHPVTSSGFRQYDPLKPNG